MLKDNSKKLLCSITQERDFLAQGQLQETKKCLSCVIEHRSLLELSLSIEKSLSCLIEHRSLLELSLSIEKSLSCVIEQLVIRHYILVELSLEVQGGHDYFRFVEGTCIIGCVLSFSVLFYYLLH